MNKQAMVNVFLLAALKLELQNLREQYEVPEGDALLQRANKKKGLKIA